jgi:hypothetical protein
MKGLATLATLVVLLLPAHLSAQSIYIGAGASIPVSDYNAYANTGFITAVGVTLPVGDQGLALVGEGFFGQNSHDDEGDKTNPYGVMAGLTYEITGADEAKGVYFFGEAGLLVHKYGSDTFESSSDTGFGFGAGAGFFFPLGGVTGWLEGRAMNATIDSEKTSFLGFLFGVSFPVGQS